MTSSPANPSPSTQSVPTATTADSATNQPAEEEKIYTIDVVFTNLIDMTFDFLMNGEHRNAILFKIPSVVQSVVMNAAENFMDGDMGKRGEKAVLTTTVLMFFILFGVGNRWVYFIIQFFIKVVAFLMILVGTGIFLNAIWEMKEHFSLLLTPSHNNKVVTSGMYKIIRHPMYCGIVMLAFGWSISQQQIFKVVLSMALFVVLVSVEKKTCFTLFLFLFISFPTRIMLQRKKKNISRKNTQKLIQCMRIIKEH
jgi:protein-S-isoprenylcysteine O-methyltransferase Ste14